MSINRRPARKLTSFIDFLSMHPLVLGFTLNSEAIQNMVALPRKTVREQRATFDEVVEFLLAAVRIRQAQVPPGFADQCTFYAWHDAQGCQLRCSVARCSPAGLPFRAPVELVPDLSPVVQAFLDGGEALEWDEFTFDADSPPRDDMLPLIQVWAVPLSPSSG